MARPGSEHGSRFKSACADLCSPQHASQVSRIHRPRPHVNCQSFRQRQGHRQQPAHGTRGGRTRCTRPHTEHRSLPSVSTPRRTARSTTVSATDTHRQPVTDRNGRPHGEAPATQQLAHAAARQPALTAQQLPAAQQHNVAALQPATAHPHRQPVTDRTGRKRGETSTALQLAHVAAQSPVLTAQQLASAQQLYRAAQQLAGTTPSATEIHLHPVTDRHG